VGARALFDNDRLQRVLGRAAGDYELALHLARTSSECTPDDCRLLEQAVVEVFRSQIEAEEVPKDSAILFSPVTSSTVRSRRKLAAVYTL